MQYLGLTKQAQLHLTKYVLHTQNMYRQLTADSAIQKQQFYFSMNDTVG